ncbi:Wzz/FepE/Etk N-terminal domain-containing protein [Rhodophyticola sp. SM2404]
MPDTQQHDDEIDLFELVQTLWDGKWLIGGISSAALAIGGAYLAVTPNSFDASIELSPIDAVYASEFRPIEGALRSLESAGLNRPTPIEGTDIAPIDHTDIVSSTGLMSEFSAVLLRRDTIAEAIRQLGMPDPRNYDTEAEYDQELTRRVFEVGINSVEIAAPTPSGTTRGWEISWQSDDTSRSDAFIDELIDLTNAASRQRVLERINAEANEALRATTRRGAQIERQIENSLQDYQINISDQLSYLSEQASLARSLGIEQGTGTGTSFSTSQTRASPAGPLSGMTYMDGYLAIERQIEILSSREQLEAFVPNLRGLQSELRSLQQDTTLEDIQQAVGATPLRDEQNFQAVQYDLSAVEINHHKKPSLILALSLVLGGFFGAAAVLIRGALRSRVTQS